MFFFSVVAGVAHRLHNKHGKNVVLLGDGCQAVRVGGYAHGIVFSAKELKADELFEVRNCSQLRPFAAFEAACTSSASIHNKRRHCLFSPSRLSAGED